MARITVTDSGIIVKNDGKLKLYESIKNIDSFLTVANIVACHAEDFKVENNTLYATTPDEKLNKLIEEVKTILNNRLPEVRGYVIGKHSEVTLLKPDEGFIEEEISNRQTYRAVVLGRKIYTKYYMYVHVSKSTAEEKRDPFFIEDYIYLAEVGKKVSEIPGEAVSQLMEDLGKIINIPIPFMTRKGAEMFARRYVGVVLGLTEVWLGRKLMENIYNKMLVYTFVEETPKPLKDVVLNLKPFVVERA